MPRELLVLHVDDEPQFVDLASTFLEREDGAMEVLEATSAAEGRELLAEHAVDCIVSDYDMPGTDGIEFLEAVREDSPELPFILYTGKGSEEVASDAISAGVTDYLQKGTDTSQYAVLANRIRNAAEGYRAERQLKDSQQRLDLFVEQSPLGVIRWDEAFDLARMNPAAEEILGYEEADLVGESWQAIVPESDRAAVDAVVEGLLEDAGGYHSVNENVRKDGERIVCEWHNRVITDEAGEVVAIYSQFQDVTEQRRQERHFEAIFQNSLTFLGLLEPDGTVVEINEASLSFGDLDREAVVGEPFWEMPVVAREEAVRETVREGIERAQSGEQFRDELRVRGSEGAAVFDFSIRPVTDDDGEVVLLVPEGRDVTAREESRHELDAVIDNLPGYVYRHRYEEGWPLEFVKGSAEPITGYTAEELTQEIVLAEETIHPEDREAVRAGVEAGLEAEGHYDLTYRIHAKDGEVRWIRDQGRLVEHPASGREFLDGFVTDVTDRERREQDLQRTTTVQSTLLAALPVGVLAEDEDREVLAVNERFLELFDVTTTPADLAGADCAQLARDASEHFADPEAFLEGIEALIETPRPVDGEEFELLDGRTLERAHRPIDLPEGGGHLWLYRDVTAQRAYEGRLERQNDRLEEFARVVSHDLRTPLSVAEGRLEMAQEECASDHLRTVEGAHRRMRRLIEDLLELAREGESAVEREPIDFAELLEECWATVETNEATLGLEVDGEIRAERTRLRQLFENLFRNAVQHGGEDVTVTVGPLEDGFYVADDGEGLPPDDVFEAGYSTAASGTGFGLRIAQQVALAHDWEIEATAGEDGGARFEVTGVEWDG